MVNLFTATFLFALNVNKIKTQIKDKDSQI